MTVIIKFSNKLMKKHKGVILKRKLSWKAFKDIWYRIDWRNTKVRNLRGWFDNRKDQIAHLPKVKQMLMSCNKLKTNDQKAIYILKWVRSQITYLTDMELWQVRENWEDPLEVLKSKRITIKGKKYYGCFADCESQATVVASLLYLAGVPDYQWVIRCGSMSNGGGHAYVVYTSDSNALEYDLDTTWLYDKKGIEYRTPIREKKQYVNTWFGFNHVRSYKEIKNPNKMFLL